MYYNIIVFTSYLLLMSTAHVRVLYESGVNCVCTIIIALADFYNYWETLLIIIWQT